MNRGNSGGPTFNLAGEVIGVNTAIVSPTGGNIGIAFAIPSETVQNVVAQLQKTGTVTRGYLGVQIQPVTKEIAESLNLKSEEGALVGEVQPGLPAAQAGMKSGDIVIDVDGTPIKTVRELQRKIASFRPDSTVKVKVLRDGKEQVLEVRLARLPDQQASNEPRMDPRKGPRRNDRDRSNRDDSRDSRDSRELNLSQLGITVAPASEVQGAKAEGIIVTDVDGQGPAGERGLRTGDVILEVGGRNVSRAADLNDAMAAARKEGKSVILLRVKSQGGTRYVTLPVGKG